MPNIHKERCVVLECGIVASVRAVSEVIKLMDWVFEGLELSFLVKLAY